MGQPSDRGNRSVPSLLSEKDNLTRSKGAGGDFGNVHRHRRPRCYDVAEQVLRRHDNSEFEADNLSGNWAGDPPRVLTGAG